MTASERFTKDEWLTLFRNDPNGAADIVVAELALCDAEIARLRSEAEAAKKQIALMRGTGAANGI